MGWGKLFSSVVENIKKTVTEELDLNLPKHPSPAASSKPSQASQPVQSRVVSHERSDAEWVAYFREILQTEFSQYTFKENVPVVELAGYVSDEFQLYSTRPRQVYKAEWGMPYSFVLYQAGVPRGVVMLGKGHSHDQNVKYLIARKYAQKMNLPYINFYTQMENERNYVVERIHQFSIR